jgi:glutamate synthase domain-containing protein 2
VRWTRASLGAAAGIAAVAAHDVLQRRHAILRNFPVVGHARYAIEKIGPELSSTSSPATTRSARSAGTSAAGSTSRRSGRTTTSGFGTDNDVEHTAGYVIVKHRTFGRTAAPSGDRSGHDASAPHSVRGSCPAPDPHLGEDAWLPCAKVLGAARGRRHALRPDSVVNISGMSFGSLSGNAVTALNRGAALAGCLQNTGEGSISPTTVRAGS